MPRSPNPPPDITDASRARAEEQIRTVQKDVRYDTRDFPIETIVKRYQDDDFFIPPYQREFVWDEAQQSRFMESVLMGLPIPMMFLAETEESKLEIVDGAQRIRSLEAFFSGDLRLNEIDVLSQLKGFTFSDLPEGTKRWLRFRSLRIIVLESSTTDDTKQILFNRINKFGEPTKPSERRVGAMKGKFMDFLLACSKNPLFLELCPLSASQEKRREGLELVTRFFAFSDEYQHFKHDVETFLDEYVLQHNRFDKKRMEQEFQRMLEFVKKYFPYGFAKGPKSSSTPRVRFEAIAVGVNLALRIKVGLQPPSPKEWIDSPGFRSQTTTHASNSAPRLSGRVEYVRDKLLGVEPA